MRPHYRPTVSLITFSATRDTVPAIGETVLELSGGIQISLANCAGQQATLRVQEPTRSARRVRIDRTPPGDGKTPSI
jgi:hypothetical protein